MLMLTNRILQVGDSVGYLEKYIGKLDDFLPKDIGVVMSLTGRGLYEVNFQDEIDWYNEHQLVYIEKD